MKKSIITSISTILLCFSVNTYAIEYEFVAGDQSPTTQICMAAVTDDTNLLEKKLRRLRRSGTVSSMDKIVNSIACNDLYVGNFALKYNAVNASAYLDKYTNKRNKKQRNSITIHDIASEQGDDKKKITIVFVAKN